MYDFVQWLYQGFDLTGIEFIQPLTAFGLTITCGSLMFKSLLKIFNVIFPN